MGKNKPISQCLSHEMSLGCFSNTGDGFGKTILSHTPSEAGRQKLEAQIKARVRVQLGLSPWLGLE